MSIKRLNKEIRLKMRGSTNHSEDDLVELANRVHAALQEADNVRIPSLEIRNFGISYLAHAENRDYLVDIATGSRNGTIGWMRGYLSCVDKKYLGREYIK